ncbi:hypothetical protein MKX01_037165 [Papaver californicum]|nr:hypothetical protein MKX01_037165 [Papaver californicum]
MLLFELYCSHFQGCQWNRVANLVDGVTIITGFYKNWAKSKKKAFVKYSKKYETEDGKKGYPVSVGKTEEVLCCHSCLGSYPARVSYTVARAGQNGYHHHTEMNKKIYRLGKVGHESHTAVTEFDRISQPSAPPMITPMGGFPHYGLWYGERGLLVQTSRLSMEEIKLKFIDTSSKFGHGRFRTTAQKAKYSRRVKS